MPSNQPARPSLAPSPTPVPAPQASLLLLLLPPPPNRLSQKRNRVLVQDLTSSSSSSSRTISRATTLSSYQHTISLQSMKMGNSGERDQARQVTKYRLLTTWIGSLAFQEGRRVELLCGRCWTRQCGIMCYDLGGRGEM